MNIKLSLNSLNSKGDIVYKYHPFHNFLTNENLYLVDNLFIVPEEKAVNISNGLILTEKLGKWIDLFNNEIPSSLVKTYQSGELYARAGSLIDLDTEKLNFSLNHPVDITVLPSYDGSVNLILNDGYNIPRLINSRFSVREKNTYEVVDRIGENDTNIYSSDNFDKDTSLYFQYESNPKILYNNFIYGVFPVGEYCFYINYCDADNNESDIIAESGVIPLFKGLDGNPSSVDGGIKNENSNKGISITLSGLDKSYNYIKVSYVRFFADYNQNRVVEYKKITLKYPILSNYCSLNITGEEITEDLDPNILNISRFNPKSVLALAQCKNILFFGNIVKNYDNYRELLDCALRILPELYVSDFESSGLDYKKGNYYESKNIYNKVGYSDNEYYRFGVVFIYNNGTLSSVYNTLGLELKLNSDVLYKKESIYLDFNSEVLTRNYINIDDFGWILNGSDFFSGTLRNLNSKGVCKILANINDWNKIIGIKFNIPYEVLEFLENSLNIRGLFFVRQKCIPNIITLCLILPMDNVLKAPVININNVGYRTECFLALNENCTVTQNYHSRLFVYQSDNSIDTKSYAGICPDFLLNLPYFNQIFNGGTFTLRKVGQGTLKNLLGDNERIYKITNLLGNEGSEIKVTICSVTEDCNTVAIKDKTYKSVIGVAEEAYRFGYAGYEEADNKFDSFNKVRGIYSPYLAIYSDAKLESNCLYNVYTSLDYRNESLLYLNRMDSSNPFYAISDRYNFGELNKISILFSSDSYLICYRGDSYINTFTYRLNRNFNDPTLPNNDSDPIDKETWKNNYANENPPTKKDFENIIRSDINGIKMGSWITFLVRSNINYALRSQDHSFVSEKALMGSPRTFYPRTLHMENGTFKMPDSYLYNDAYRNSLGYKCYFTLLDINYLKNSFSNRILYSAIAIQDSFKNNYRESLSTYYRDYSTEYGGITKLIGFEGHLLVVLEHAIGIAVINERVLAGEGDGEPVFINTKNVLPEELTIITDTYGSLWPESIIKTEAGNVYGIDTVSKKIWRVKRKNIEILSDFKVGEFLNKNLTLKENELQPIIGLKNVKTHYNNNKKDVIFTFYNEIYKDEEKVWSLCYNELLELFITFYSWIPSYSENIDTQFFTFNRNISKELTLASISNYYIPENTGVLIENPTPNFSDDIITTLDQDNIVIRYKNITKLHYRNNIGEEISSNIEFRLEKDHWNNYKKFEIRGRKNLYYYYDSLTDLPEKPIFLYITPIIDSIEYPTESIIIIPEKTYEKKSIIQYSPNDFYLHGNAGIIDVKEELCPTYWYGEYHPFEIEFVVNDKIGLLKIFTNLSIISNKAEPESFHFEIEGDNYEFSNDKRTMYFRQEATKNLYLNLGSNITYDRKYTDAIASKYTQEQYYRGGEKYSYTTYVDRVYPVYLEGLVRQVKSTIFPIYYERIDTYDDIYHKYHKMKGNDSYDFKNLSGSEIIWNKNLNQFNIVTHIKNSPINLFGKMRGNSYYNEGRWNIQIPSISFMLKNEEEWPEVRNYSFEDGPLKDLSEKIPPIVINSQYVPNDLNKNSLGIEDLPNIYTGKMTDINKDDTTSVNLTEYVKISNWTFRKEAKIRDKWMKVRVRYSGKNLAIIHSLVTLYNISYS